MKFLGLIVLAIAACANASWAPAGPSLTVSGPWGAWGAAPWAAANHWGGAAHWGAAPWGAAPWAAANHWDGAPWGAAGHWGAPAAIAAHAPAAVYAPALGATYTAANRGSAHTAPLPGHAVSVKSLNVAPAPGTTW